MRATAPRSTCGQCGQRAVRKAVLRPAGALALRGAAARGAAEARHAGTFTLLAALIGGLRPCAALARAVGAPQPWRVLCRGEARLLGRPRSQRRLHRRVIV